MVNFLQNRLVRHALVLAALGGFTLATGTQDTQAASDDPVLTISGKVTAESPAGEIEMELAELEALGMVTVQTATPWHDGKVTFEGIPLQKLMEHVGASGESVTAIALNDYSSKIPLSDFASYGTILAIKTNGEYMSVREKGPFFVIYPYDSNPALRSQQFYSRSVWQVSELVVE